MKSGGFSVFATKRAEARVQGAKRHPTKRSFAGTPKGARDFRALTREGGARNERRPWSPRSANVWQISCNFAKVWQKLKTVRRMVLPMLGKNGAILPNIGKIRFCCENAKKSHAKYAKDAKFFEGQRVFGQDLQDCQDCRITDKTSSAVNREISFIHCKLESGKAEFFDFLPSQGVNHPHGTN